MAVNKFHKNSHKIFDEENEKIFLLIFLDNIFYNDLKSTLKFQPMVNK